MTFGVKWPLINLRRHHCLKRIRNIDRADMARALLVPSLPIVHRHRGAGSGDLGGFRHDDPGDYVGNDPQGEGQDRGQQPARSLRTTQWQRPTAEMCHVLSSYAFP